MTAKPDLRAATPEDAALIAHLTRSAWTGRVDPSSSVYRETESEIARQIVEGGGFVLSIGGEAVGSARYSPVPDAWEVRRMGVLPAHRGNGYAAFMMDAVVTLALRRGIGELRLGVRHDQPRLLTFYATMGFVLAPELKYTHANPANPPPTVMRRKLAGAAYAMTTVKHLRIRGHVQGVGYRYAMRSQADICGVTGWVRNRRDGTVEAVVAGDDPAVEQMIVWARQGPPGAAVTEIEIEVAEGSFSTFDMRSTE